MSVQYEFDSTTGTITIAVSGHFNLSYNRDFRDAYTPHLEDIKHIVIEFKDTSTIDSSALGMLLLLRQTINSRGRDIKIQNCNTAVKDVLKNAYFDTLFQIT